MIIYTSVRAILVAFLSLSIVSGKSPAQEPPASVHPRTVNVKVDGDEDLASRVKSYVSSELRDLKDVKISDTQPTFVITCIVAPVKVGEATFGYAASFVVTSNLQSLKYIAGEFAKKLDDCEGSQYPVQGIFLTSLCRLTQQVESQHLVTGAISDLKEMCSNQIAEFDGKCLEPLRRGSATQ